LPKLFGDEEKAALVPGMKWLRMSLGVIGVTALSLSFTTAAQVAWALIALVAGLAMLGVVILERRASG
jgi:hypothetical protein